MVESVAERAIETAGERWEDPLELACTKCGTVLDLSGAQAGERVECPGCKTRYRLRPSKTVSNSAPLNATQSPTTPSPHRVPTTGAPTGGFPPRESVFVAGEVIAERYLVQAFLARGGMGEVYDVEDLELRGRLALKTIAAGKGDPNAIERFKREIQLARMVTHPNVCRIYDLGQHRMLDAEPVVFLTMELLRGETLADQIRRRGAMRPAVCGPLVHQMAAALDAAHQAGIVHRDLKSENVFLVPDGPGTRLVVTDFGIARGGGGDALASQLTGGGSIGTPAYMAPEQVEGKLATVASDVYAFGVVIYEMVTGRLPFEADDPIRAAVKRLQEPPTPLRSHAPDLDPAWDAAIMRCLARRPEDRFPTAGSVVAALLDGAGTQRTAIAPTATTPNLTAASPATTPIGVGPTTPMPRPPRAPTEAAGAPSVTNPPAIATPNEAGPPSQAATRTVTMTVPIATGRTRRLLGALAAVLVVSALLWTFNLFRDRDDDERRLITPRRSVAVLGFRNLSGSEDDAWLATALAEMLATELAQGDGLRVVPGATVARMREELAVTPGEELGAERLQQIRSLLACDIVSSGSYVALSGADGGRLRVDLKLQDATTGSLLDSTAHDAARSELFALVQEAGEGIRRRLGVEESSGSRVSAVPRDPRAAKLYSEALDHLHRAEPLPARDRLVEAARMTPDNALVQLALSTAWQGLGYEAQAREAASRAFELSRDLDREERLTIEGRYRETLGDWTAAAAAYEALWDYRPDNLEYGLRLAAAQLAAFRGPDALATVVEMRQLPSPLGDDLRIDLTESRASGMTSAFDEQLVAADAAAAKAAGLGASLLEASAQLARASALRTLGRTDEAARAADRANELYRDLDHQAGMAQASTAAANIAFGRGDLEEAEIRWQDALARYRALGDRGGEAGVLGSLAVALRKRGDFARAEALYREAGDTFRDTGNQAAIANNLNNLASLFATQERLAQAEGLLQDSYELWQKIGNQSGQAYALANLAGVRRRAGKLRDSLDAGQRALALRREIDHPQAELASLSGLAAVHLDRGDLPAARDNLEAAMRLAERLDLPDALASLLYRRGEAARLAGDLGDARTRHEEALTLRRGLDDPLVISESRLALARVALEEGQAANAAVEAERLAETFERQGRPGQALLARAILVRAHLEDGRRVEAVRLADTLFDGARETELTVARFEAAIARARANPNPMLARPELASAAESMEAADYRALALEAQLALAAITVAEGDEEAGQQLAREVAERAQAAGLGSLFRRASGSDF